ncbi:MAG: ribonuclease HI [Desulfovibrionaceae bacterium]|nr:ribonuclease HI [Desulfovibrionaceae bacterium]MBF0512915.1 ribonuclease HI [Desulfovibrionaceae bacterium]
MDPKTPQAQAVALGYDVLIHTDGACLGNPGPGGYAAVLECNGKSRELAAGYRRTTNNRMELLAVIEALASLTEPCSVELYTDSKYVGDAVEKGWLSGWRRNGWKTADKKPVKNQDLWRRLMPLLETHTVRFHWLRGHAGHKQNERCDALAKNAATAAGLLKDEGYETA